MTLVRSVILDSRSARSGFQLVVLVAQVVHRDAARQIGDCGPQRVVRHGDEHLVAVVEQCLQRDLDQLGHTVADPDVVDVDQRESFLELVVMHDGTAGRLDATRVRVASRGRQTGDHVLQDLRRRIETEGLRIADVELEDAVTLGLQLGGSGRDRTSDVVQDISQLLGLAHHVAHAAILPSPPLPPPRPPPPVPLSPAECHVQTGFTDENLSERDTQRGLWKPTAAIEQADQGGGHGWGHATGICSAARR